MRDIFGKMTDNRTPVNKTELDAMNTHQMSTIYQGFEVLGKDARKTLFDLLSEYTKTPIEDREEKTL